MRHAISFKERCVAATPRTILCRRVDPVVSLAARRQPGRELCPAPGKMPAAFISGSTPPRLEQRPLALVLQRVDRAWGAAKTGAWADPALLCHLGRAPDPLSRR